GPVVGGAAVVGPDRPDLLEIPDSPLNQDHRQRRRAGNAGAGSVSATNPIRRAAPARDHGDDVVDRLIPNGPLPPWAVAQAIAGLGIRVDHTIAAGEHSERVAVERRDSRGSPAPVAQAELADRELTRNALETELRPGTAGCGQRQGKDQTRNEGAPTSRCHGWVSLNDGRGAEDRFRYDPRRGHPVSLPVSM